MRGCKYPEWKRENKVLLERIGEMGGSVGRKIGGTMGEKMGEERGRRPLIEYTALGKTHRGT